MFQAIKTRFGVAPTKIRSRVFSPSAIALKLAVDKRTDYDQSSFGILPKATSQKILVIGTETELLRMQNGNYFLTGNHPYELFVPMLHWLKAGFEIDFATPTGQEMKLEQWALPTEDAAVMELYRQYQPKLLHPLDLRSLVAGLDRADYTAIYIPGGHGVIADLPFSWAVGQALSWAASSDRWIISICHGPASFLAMSVRDFPLSGYSIAAFPDRMDRVLPPTGYLPGSMPWYFGEKLEALGMTLVNRVAVGTVHMDRKLITGDGPKAANELGRKSTEVMLADNPIDIISTPSLR